MYHSDTSEDRYIEVIEILVGSLCKIAIKAMAPAGMGANNRVRYQCIYCDRYSFTLPNSTEFSAGQFGSHQEECPVAEVIRGIKACERKRVRPQDYMRATEEPAQPGLGVFDVELENDGDS